jgi:type I restriction enzyme S subunit
MSAYRPYPKYKPSGVEWLGNVPEDWQVVQFKNFVNIQNGADHKHVEQTEGYPVMGSGGIFAYASDFLYDGESVLLGRKGTIDKPLHVTGRFWTVDTMYWTKISPGASGRFTYYTALTIPFGYYSTNTALPSMTKGNLSSHLVAKPPLPEQHQIASFLDRECGKLDALQAKQERLIELLKEKRQALISHAVTKGLPGVASAKTGLDPTAKLKSSGIEWLGDVPEHWKVVSFGQCVAIAGGQVDPTAEPFLNYVMIAPNHIESKVGNLLALETAAEQGAESGKYLCKKGDVIYSKIRPALAKACLCPQDQVICSADMYPMRGMLGMTNGFLLKVLLSAEFTTFAIMESDRVAMPKLNRETLATTRLPIPPLAEQRAIVAHLDEKCGKIDQLKAKAERGIELLKERRSALISAAVTGKIDLRDHLTQSHP